MSTAASPRGTKKGRQSNSCAILKKPDLNNPVRDGKGDPCTLHKRPTLCKDTGVFYCMDAIRTQTSCLRKDVHNGIRDAHEEIVW